MRVLIEIYPASEVIEKTGLKCVAGRLGFSILVLRPTAADCGSSLTFSSADGYGRSVFATVFCCLPRFAACAVTMTLTMSLAAVVCHDFFTSFSER